MNDNAKIDNGGDAFPKLDCSWKNSDGDLQHSHDGGMSLRDYFAAKAMQAAATNPRGADGFTFEQRASWAYQQADAMLKARAA